MKIRLIFEDNVASPVSILLQGVYGKDEILFLDGNCNILRMLNPDCSETFYNEEDIFIIYLDVVPDRIETLNKYTDIKKALASYKFSNVFICPIPCIEYFLILSFWDRTVIEAGSVFERHDFQPLKGVLQGRRNITSYEVYCKDVMALTGKVCQRIPEGKRQEHSLLSMYYLEPCLCTRIYDNKACSSETLQSKAEALMSSLPIKSGTIEPKDLVLIKNQINDAIAQYREAFESHKAEILM